MMTKREKALAKIRRNPKNVRFEELETILLGLGFERIPGKGSHTKFFLGEHIILVPLDKPHLRVEYIRQVLQILDELEDE